MKSFEQSKLLKNFDLTKSSSTLNCCFKDDLLKSLSRISCWSMLRSYKINERSKLLIKVDLMKSSSGVNCWSMLRSYENIKESNLPIHGRSYEIIEQSKLLTKIIEQSKLLLQSWPYGIIGQSKLLIKVDLMKSLSRLTCWSLMDLM